MLSWSDSITVSALRKSHPPAQSAGTGQERPVGDNTEKSWPEASQLASERVEREGQGAGAAPDDARRLAFGLNQDVAAEKGRGRLLGADKPRREREMVPRFGRGRAGEPAGDARA